MTTISTKELRALCLKALTNAGLQESDAAITVDHYLENEMSGKTSHGMVRVVEAAKILKKYDIPSAQPEIIIDHGHMALIDAKGHTGPVAGLAVTNEAITRAKAHGMALIGARNFIVNTGSMAYYLRRLTSENLVALIWNNSVPCVAPPGGIKPVIGTNPVGIGIPGENGDGMIADLGTAAMAYGKMLALDAKGDPIPEGVIIDTNGNPSTDIKDALSGAILPLAGYKGFALGLMVELLSGPLMGAKAIQKNYYGDDGFFCLAIDPLKFGNTDFYKDISASLTAIRQSPPQEGTDKVTIPGERSGAKLAKSSETGSIDIAEATLGAIREFAQ